MPEVITVTTKPGTVALDVAGMTIHLDPREARRLARLLDEGAGRAASGPVERVRASGYVRSGVSVT